MIIALTGNEGVGKDYTAKRLKEALETKGYEVEIETFAKPIHKLVKRLINCDNNKLDKFKRRKQNKIDKFLNKFGLSRVDRDMLKTIGETLKECFGDDIFINRLKIDKSKITIITDLRFMNEFEFILRNNGIIINITKALETKGYELEEILQKAEFYGILYHMINFITPEIYDKELKDMIEIIETQITI